MKPNVKSTWGARLQALEIPRFRDERGGVSSLAVSPDNVYLAVGQDSGRILLFETHTFRLHKEITGTEYYTFLATEAVTSLAFSKDSEMLASCTDGDTNTVFIWNTSTGLIYYELVGLQDVAFPVTFSRSGLKVAAGSHEGFIGVWNLSYMQKESSKIRRPERLKPTYLIPEKVDVRNTKQHSSLYYGGKIVALEFTPSGSLISASSDRILRVWDVETCNLKNTIGPTEQYIVSFALSSDTRKLFVATHSMVIVYDFETLIQLQTYKIPNGSSIASFLPLSPAEALIGLERSSPPDCRVIHLHLDNKEIRYISEISLAEEMITIQERFLVTAAKGNRELILWDKDALFEGRSDGTTNDSPNTKADFVYDKEQAVTLVTHEYWPSSTRRLFRGWKTNTFERKFSLDCTNHLYTGDEYQFSSDKTICCIRESIDTLILFDMRSGLYIRSAKIPEEFMKQYIAASKVNFSEGLDLMNRFRFASSLGILTFSSDNSLLAASFGSGTIIWSLTAKKDPDVIWGSFSTTTIVTAITFSSDSAVIAISSRARLMIWSLAERKEVCSTYVDELTGAITKPLIFSSCSRYILFGTDLGKVLVWDVLAKSFWKKFSYNCSPFDFAPVQDLAFSQDTELIAACYGTLDPSQDRHTKNDLRSPKSETFEFSVAVWNLSTGSCILNVVANHHFYPLSFESNRVLTTSHGYIEVDLTGNGEHKTPQEAGIKFKKWSLSRDMQWITYNGQNVLWLPESFRSTGRPLPQQLPISIGCFAYDPVSSILAFPTSDGGIFAIGLSDSINYLGNKEVSRDQR